MRYAYIREHHQEYGVRRMCQLLAVAHSGYLTTGKSSSARIDESSAGGADPSRIQSQSKDLWQPMHPGGFMTQGNSLWTTSSGTFDAQARKSGTNGIQ